jgi:hypothetical protein
MSNTDRSSNPATNHNQMSNTGRDVKTGRGLKKGVSNNITSDTMDGNSANQDIVLDGENMSNNSEILYQHQSTNNIMKNEENDKIHNFLLETWRPTTSFYFKEKRGSVNEVENKVVADVIAKKGIINAKKGDYKSFSLPFCQFSFFHLFVTTISSVLNNYFHF